MTEETDTLHARIQQMKEQTSDKPNPTTAMTGYNATIYMLTDLFACIFVGLVLGLFLQKVFETSVLLTAGLTLLGGIAGLWTMVRYALNLSKRQDAFLKAHPEPQKPIAEDTDED